MAGELKTDHKGIVAWWAKNAVAANLLMVMSIVAGIAGFFLLEREVFPQADFNGASVSIAWPGASPRDVEEQIVTRIEEVMADIDGLKRMTGVAREGVGYVNLEAYLDYDIQEFIDEVKLRTDQINNLPRDAFQPQVSRWRNEDTYLGIALHGNVDPLTLKRLTDDVRDEMALLPGGDLVQAWGVLPEEITIEVSETDLRRYGMTFSEVADAIRGASLNASGGSVRSNTGSQSIQARQLKDSAEELNGVIIRQSLDGGTIRVRDVANVIDGFVDEEVKATYNGRPTSYIMFIAPEKMDIVRYTDAIKEAIAEYNDGGLPEGVRMDLLFDSSEIYVGRMNTIANSALIGSALVLIVLILFLRPIVAFWVTIGIITAFAGGFALLPMFGVSLNVLSLFAVLLVIGVVVDDAIIVGENIHSEVESGRRQGVDAAIFATQIVVKPVIFGVITTIIMFGPWAFLAGPERQFTAQISYVVVAALIFSLIESMLILPAHLAHMKQQSFDGAQGAFLKFQRSIADSLLWFAHNIFKPVLEAAIRYRYATVALFSVTFIWAVGLMVSGLLPMRIMPEIEDDLVQVTIELPDGTPFARTEQVGDQLFAGFQKAKEDVQGDFPTAEGPLIDSASIVVNERRVRAWIGLMKPEDRPDGVSTKILAEALREATGPIPDAEEIDFSFTINENDTSIRFFLSHRDLDRLREAADEVKAQLATYDTTFDIGDNLSSAANEIQLSLKPGAESLGLDLRQVFAQVRQAYYGEEVGRLPRDGEDVRVMVKYPEETRRSIDSLENMRIRTPDGREIPLYEVAEVTFAPGINRIFRRDRNRSVVVFAELSGDVRGQIMGDMEQTFWPDFKERFPEIERGFGGAAEQQADFFNNLIQLYVIALLLMYFLLAVAFKSYFQPLLIMTALPFGFAGAAFGHMVFGIPLALFSFFGIAAAAGVVINDNLVLVDFINRRREEGVGAVQAIVEAGTARFRPILLTSVTTFVGILPMIAENSIQAQFLKPMVVALGFAVAFALFVSLLMVPALYAVGVEIGRIFQWSWNGTPYRRIGETYHGIDGSVDEPGMGRPREIPGAAPAE